jgi:SAM-dependent methyltransferase
MRRFGMDGGVKATVSWRPPEDPETKNQAFFEAFWGRDTSVYDNHPTSRHRQRFIVRSLSRCQVGRPGFRVFDYGCGTGAVLKLAQKRLGLDETQVAGCDIAPRALDIVWRRFPGGSFHLGAYPVLDQPFSAAVCSEVIEHTDGYPRILAWLHDNLLPGGMLVLTTQAKPMNEPDRVYGHVQHFDLRELTAELEAAGFRVEHARLWGAPFYTLQRALTGLFYRQIEERVIASPLTSWKRAIFRVAYRVYMVHDLIPAGPQIFIRAYRRER